jgi:ribonuclease HII
MMKVCKYIIGIDEAGRGPLAGPVSVGVALIPADFDWSLLPGVGDSKKISPKKREVIFELAQKLKQEGRLDYSVSLISAKKIDAFGIVPAINEALSKSLDTAMSRNLLANTQNVSVKLDGGLRAPVSYLQQETIIKGDDKELIIGLASIMAKVTRDKYMEKIAKKAEFSSYSFEIHKGYGTKKHLEAILKNGLSTEHRKSFCRNYSTKTVTR